MKSPLLSLVLIVSFFTSQSVLFAQNSNDTIHWHPGYKLAWDDFIGIENRFSDTGAVTDAQIQYFYQCTNGKYSFNVVCYFNKKNSWVRTGYATLDALRHEQGHFDIAAIFARKLQRLLDNSTIGHDKKDAQIAIDNLAQRIFREQNDVQKRYDEQTDFHRNSIQQKKWETKIQKMLDAHSDIKSK